MLDIGSILDDTYQIIQEIGTGGTGIIFLAYHLRLKKYVVVKKIKDNFVGKIDARIEVDMLKQLHHQGLPQVYDFLQLDNNIYTIMDYIEGYDLDYYLKRGYRFSEEDITHYLIQLLDVLIYLHGQSPSIIHCDIKPANIMLDHKGNMYLIDFNISFDSEQGKVMGVSEHYASYEQMEAARLIMNRQDVSSVTIDIRTDIYSLGATFYHLMTGVQPYIGIEEQYPIYNYKISYSEALLNIIDKAMRWNREERYASAKEMKDALESKHKQTRSYRLKRMLIIVGCTVGALAIGATGIGLVQNGKKQRMDAFNAEYTQVIQTANSGESVNQQAMEILNNQDYKNILYQNSDKKAELLYLIASDYFNQEQYEVALSYYEEAVTLNKNSVYYRDYAITFARLGRFEEANQIVIQASGFGIESYEIDEINAEICVQKHQYEQAIQLLEPIIQNSNDDELRYRAVKLLVKCYDYMPNSQELITLLSQTTFSYEYQDSFQKLMLYAYTRQASVSNNEEKKNCYIQALACYDAIQNKSVLSMEDLVSVAAVCQYLNQQDKGEMILQELQQQYSDDYRIYMQLALYCYNEESGYGNSVRDYSQVEEYYELALERYIQSGSTDEKMTELEQIINDLREKGWLE